MSVRRLKACAGASLSAIKGIRRWKKKGIIRVKMGDSSLLAFVAVATGGLFRGGHPAFIAAGIRSPLHA